MRGGLGTCPSGLRYLASDVRNRTLDGILAYSVNQRTREIGLRMALGAARLGVLGLVVRDGMTVGVIGIGAGLAGALALGGVARRSAGGAEGGVTRR